MFDDKVPQLLQLAKNYPKFGTYFMKHVRPALKNYVFGPSNENNVRKWTNNNCESLNHILKLEAGENTRSNRSPLPNHYTPFQGFQGRYMVGKLSFSQEIEGALPRNERMLAKLQ